jgi:SAM-dependent methyltransferase
MQCILCNSKNVIIKEKYPIEGLKSLWGFVDTSEELKIDKLCLYQCYVCSLKFFDPQLAGGDKFYSELGKQEWYYLHPGKTEYEYVQKYIKEGDKILDIGAGRGVLFTKIIRSVDYTGLELSSKAAELAQTAGINVMKEDLILHAQNNKDSYDIVCLFQVLEHLTALDTFLKSIQLVLKSKGYFVIAVPNNEGFIAHTPNYTFNLPPHHTILWTETSLRFLAQKYGYNIVDVEIELLQDVHKSQAYRSYYIHRLKKILGLPNLLIDTSLGHRVLSKLVSFCFKIKGLNRIVISFASKRQKYGQSIIVTLQKA